MSQPDAYWEEAHAPFHHCREQAARIWAEAEEEPETEPEAGG